MAEDASLDELEQERDFLLRSLDDLDRERSAGDLGEADHAELRERYTVRAAEVLRAIEEERPVRSPAARRARSWVVIAAAVTALALAAGLAVAAASGSRLPGQTVTGDAGGSGASRLAQAAAVAEDDPQRALELYDEILADDPDDVGALSERGLLLATLGASLGRPPLLVEGRRSVERAVELAPEDPRVLFSRGLTLRLDGDDRAAEEAFAEALTHDPAPGLRQQIEAFRSSTPAGG